jgi:Dehydrogenases with different specificities (related to short-chain alcohol dehydrogenases)
MKLKGKVAIITGGGRGIGRAIALAYAAEGARLIVTAAREWKEIQEVASVTGGTAIQADVTNKEDVDKVIRTALSTYGKVDILVNNAARGMKYVSEDFITTPAFFWKIDPEVWRMIIDTNINGVFLMTRAVIPIMLEQRFGRIINISVHERTMKRKGFSPYGPSKAALESMSTIWSKELEGTGVTLNMLLPGGATHTGMVPSKIPKEQLTGLLKPEVMGPAAVYLASDEAAQINGKRIVAIEWNEEQKNGKRNFI